MYNPEVDFNGKFAENMIFVNHRDPLYKSWFKILLSFSTRISNIFRKYISGYSLSYYNNTTFYSFGDQIVYKRSVYESITDINSSNQPDISPAFWEKISDIFIGVQERSLYTGQKIILEYALNKYFKYELSAHGYIGFRQPDSPTTPTNSDIYLTPVVPAFYSFSCFATELNSDSVFENYSTGIIYGDEVVVTNSSYVFNINIPSVVYSDLGTSSVADKIIDNFVKKYIASGITYNIVTY